MKRAPSAPRYGGRRRPHLRPRGPHGPRGPLLRRAGRGYYVPETDQWTSVTPMRAGQSGAGCCLLDRKIYIVGGYNWRLNNVTGLVQVYNTETDSGSL